MLVTDILTLILSIFLLSRGASRGFLKSLIPPFSIIVTTILSIIYYQITKDAFASLLIGLISPLLLNLLLKFLLKKWIIATNSAIKPSLLSRLGGALLTLVWGWVFIIFTLILLAVLPPWGKQLTAIHHDVTESVAYSIIQPVENIFFPVPKKNTAAAADENSNDNAKSLSEDPRFQKVLQDPDIQAEINAHDIAKLMRDPKMMELVQQIMSDPAAMKKVMAVYSSQSQSQPQPQGPSFIDTVKKL